MFMKRLLQKLMQNKGVKAKSLFVFALITIVCAPGFSDNQESADKLESVAKSRRLTEFEWDPIDNAKSYEIEIKPINEGQTSQTPYLFSVTNPRWAGELKPGKYSMRLRSRDKRGVPGDWNKRVTFYVKLEAPKILSPKPDEIIESNDAENYKIELKWALQTEAKKYIIHIEDEYKRFSQDLEREETDLRVKLPVARKYLVTMMGIDKNGQGSEPFGPPLTFTIIGKKLETPRIDEPTSPFVRKLTWEPIPFSETYSYELLRRAPNRKWVPFKADDKNKTNKLEFEPQWKGGEYKLSVTANAKNRLPSSTHSLIFEVAMGDRSIAAEQIAQMRESIARTNNWYLVASYLITQIEYSANNFDKGSSPHTLALGGTGRLGAGYLAEKSPYGFLGIADFSGFIIGQKNYTYPSFEGHGIVRFASSSLSELRLSGGAYYKELPEVLGYAETGEYSLSQLGALGFHGGGEFWYSLNPKLGIQMNARVYYPLAGKTPSGKPLVATPSYQFGFLGSLRLNKKATGLMGYAYRNDQIDYQVSNNRALDAGHTINHTSVIGHYLNFFLEWDL